MNHTVPFLEPSLGYLILYCFILFYILFYFHSSDEKRESTFLSNQPCKTVAREIAQLLFEPVMYIQPNNISKALVNYLWKTEREKRFLCQFLFVKRRHSYIHFIHTTN